MKRLVVGLAVVLFSAWAFLGLRGQTGGASPAASQAATAPAGPALVIRDADAAVQKAVGIESVDIRATLATPLAETAVTLVFRNSAARQLDGELEFPLPEGAVITGYALDVPAGSGNLVDGVAIEKQRARQIFESEMRRRVDPGIVEHVAGNVFRTRVYPIDAGKTRTVRITYLAAMPAAAGVSTWSMPMAFGEGLKAAAVGVEVLDEVEAGAVKVAGLKSLAFERVANRLRAEQKFGNVQLAGALTVSLPASGKTEARVANYLPPVSAEMLLAPGARASEQYFFVSAQPAVAAAEAKQAVVRRIGLICDTSLSRNGADKSAEKAFLAELAGQLPESASIDCLTPDGGKPAVTVVAKGAGKGLSDWMDGLTYDGALRIDQLKITRATNHHDAFEVPQYDFYVFLSDGQVTLGKAQFGAAEVPVYTVCSDPKANHALLKKLAEGSGGLYLNLQTLKPAEAVAAMLMPRNAISLAADATQVAEVYPAGPVPVVAGQRVMFTGRLIGSEATVTLKQTGAADQTVVLKRAEAGEDRMIPRAWAMQKIADLSIDEEANAERLVAVGKRFNVVTPRTSLIVLETLEQYLRHGVVPPKSREEIYKGFVEQIESREKQRQQDEAEKISRIMALWKGRTDWWEQKFEYPANFAWRDPNKPQAGEDVVTVAPNGTAAPGMGLSGGQPRRTVAVAPPASPNVTPPTFDLQTITASGASGQAGEARGEPERHFLLNQIDLRDMTRLEAGRDAVIAIKPWLPGTPYILELKEARKEFAYKVYLEQRKKFGDAPAFYLDCGNFFLQAGQRELGIRILTDIAQLRLDNAGLLRIAAYRLLQVGDYEDAIDLFEKVARLRPEEPQSFRDLALGYAARAGNRSMVGSRPGMNLAAQSDYRRALELYQKVIMNHWDRFDEIEVVALMEANGLWAEAQRGDGASELKNPLDPRLVKSLDCDVRIVMTWDADATDIDLHVIEPSGEEAFYSHNRTTIGGLVSKDFTQGYGPEEYCLRRAMPGTYKIVANYYGSNANTLLGPVTVQATVITNFGRANEKREAMTLRLVDRKENVEIGAITIGGDKK